MIDKLMGNRGHIEKGCEVLIRHTENISGGGGGGEL